MNGFLSTINDILLIFTYEYLASHFILEHSVKTLCSYPLSLPFPTFRPILEALRVEWLNSRQRFASLPELGNEDIKYFITLSGSRTHNPSYACAPAPSI